MIEDEVRRHSIESGVSERQGRQGAVYDGEPRMLSRGHRTHRRLGFTACDEPSGIGQSRRKGAGARSDIQQPTTTRSAEPTDDNIMSPGAQRGVRGGIRIADTRPRSQVRIRPSGDSTTMTRTRTDAAIPNPEYWKVDNTTPASTAPAAADRLISESLRP